MKSVLISIRPMWCKLIANSEKTIEVRKSAPKIETPFKCYIYCTKETRANVFHLYINSGIGRQKFGITEHWRSGKEVVDVNPHLPAYRFSSYLAEGKVIGEFVCDNIECVDIPYPAFQAELDKQYIEQSCCSYWQLHRYFYHDNAYFWHISDLVIYDKPKELGSFWKAGKCPYAAESGCTYEYHCFRAGQTQRCGETLTRPPQSWCYVEDYETEEKQ